MFPYVFGPKWSPFWWVEPEEKKAAESLDDQVAAKTMKQRVAEALSWGRNMAGKWLLMVNINI